MPVKMAGRKELFSDQLNNDGEENIEVAAFKKAR